MPIPVAGYVACVAVVLFALYKAVNYIENPSVVQINLKKSGLSCLGTPVSEKIVLSAAHCLDDNNVAMEIFYGSKYYDDGNEIKIVKTFIHEGWVEKNFGSVDLAIHILERPIPKQFVGQLAQNEPEVGEYGEFNDKFFCHHNLWFIQQIREKKAEMT